MLKVASLFSQIPGEISRIYFQKLVVKYGAERHSKGFRSWTRFVSMLFCHLARAHLAPRNMPRPFLLQRKTRTSGSKQEPEQIDALYANEHRPSELFEDLFRDLPVILDSCGSKIYLILAA